MKSFYVGVKAVIIKDDAVLVLKRSSQEKYLSYFWDVPGGKVNDESFEQALKRELPEELGEASNIKIGKLLEVHRLPFDIENKHGLILLFYEVSLDLKEVSLSGEHIEYRWIAKDAINEFFQTNAEYINEGMKDAICLAFRNSE